MICSQCGKEIPEGAPFCCWCGTKCAGKVCAVCGAKLRSDQLFCHVCGLRCGGSQSVKQHNTEQPHMKDTFPLAENTLKEEPRIIMDKNITQKLTLFRKWQVSSAEMIFDVYVDYENWGSISGGKSISQTIISDSTIVEIRYYAEKSVLRSIKKIVLADLDNPQIEFCVRESTVLLKEKTQYPKIDIIVKGAKILQQEQSFV